MDRHDRLEDAGLDADPVLPDGRNETVEEPRGPAGLLRAVETRPPPLRTEPPT
jgi:hypothetical protein